MGVFSLLPLHTYYTHNKPCAHTQNKSSIYMIYVTSSLLLSRRALTLSNSLQWVLASLSLVKSIIAYIIPYPVQLVNWTERNKYYNLTPEFLVISVHDISVRVVEVEKWGDAYQVFDNASLAPFFFDFISSSANLLSSRYLFSSRNVLTPTVTAIGEKLH